MSIGHTKRESLQSASLVREHLKLAADDSAAEHAAWHLRKQLRQFIYSSTRSRHFVHDVGENRSTWWVDRRCPSNAVGAQLREGTGSVRIAAQALTCIESRPKSVSLASIALAVDGDIEGARELAGSGLAIGAGRLENALLHQTAGLFAELSGSPETAKSHYRSAAASPLPQYRINALISWLILSLREQDPDWQKCRDRLLDEDPAAVESLLRSCTG